MKIRFQSEIDYLDKLKLHYISVPKSILLELNDNASKSLFNQRVELEINDKVRWKAGTVSLGNNLAYITLSSERMKEAGASLGENVDVQIERDHSEFGFDVPEEWTFSLEQDLIAKTRFLALRKGLQRAIIYLVIQCKSSQSRIDKSLFILENLKRSPQGQTTMRHILGKDLT